MDDLDLWIKKKIKIDFWLFVKFFIDRFWENFDALSASSFPWF